MSRLRSKLVIALMMGFMYFCTPTSGYTQNVLPASAQALSNIPLQEVGSGTFHKYGFSVYHISLWAPNGKWDPKKPYALELRYDRSVSKDTLVDVLMDDIQDQGVADDATLALWKKKLIEIIPDVEDGDVLIGVYIPQKKGTLLYNGKEIASSSESAPIQAFFNIWLGSKADESLRRKLLNQS